MSYVNIIYFSNLQRILIYLLLLFFFDNIGLMNLYNENYLRRIINMYRRTDYLSYKAKLNPFCKHVSKILDQQDIINLQSIKVPNKRDLGWFTRKNTTSYQCCKKFSKSEKDIVLNISNKIRKKYEQLIGKKLYFFKNRNETIYIYYGNNSMHLWHVDPRNIKSIYNVIVCFKKVGNISPLQCKINKNHIKTIHFEEGDAALFNGGTTEHQVPPNSDPKSERHVLSVSFTTDQTLANEINSGNNMCTYLNGGNNYFNIIKLFSFTFIINLVIRKVSKLNNVPANLFFILIIVTTLISKYFPLMYHSTSMGTGRSSSITKNLIILLCIIFNTFDFKGGTLMYSYFLLSSVFFPASWVAYD